MQSPAAADDDGGGGDDDDDDDSPWVGSGVGIGFHTPHLLWHKTGCVWVTHRDRASCNPPELVASSCVPLQAGKGPAVIQCFVLPKSPFNAGESQSHGDNASMSELMPPAFYVQFCFSCIA